ncbi:hypothetical protein [Tropicimonas sediminicola]|uniref:Lipoprotein n=1 Tax=Tropicimonas sediminicola TaxID=1031541 RepID=A0A239GYA2_9RHOB|nr:hypothetical protein [Tropicimonas sediminicola]SNS74097.1 hypothetical protein SAMN05421757_103163 [Tropicimonas sediminicola]
MTTSLVRSAVRAALAAVLLAGCTPVDPALEPSLAIEFEGNSQGNAAGGGTGLSQARALPGANPAWNSAQRIPNTNPRIVTNNVYGPGQSSDAYGQVVHHNPGLIIEQTAVGSGDYRDQYGRPVTCYGSGMGTYCR